MNIVQRTSQHVVLLTAQYALVAILLVAFVLDTMPGKQWGEAIVSRHKSQLKNIAEL